MGGKDFGFELGPDSQFVSKEGFREEIDQIRNNFQFVRSQTFNKRQCKIGLDTRNRGRMILNLETEEEWWIIGELNERRQGDMLEQDGLRNKKKKEKLKGQKTA